MKKIWIVHSYNDGALVAYRSESEAVEAMDAYHIAGLYPLEETYISELFLIEDN